jgi:type II secretory pathway pseudopilin PulG
MKKNNKGFFLAETIVVIALVTTVMAFVYPNVSKLNENYNNRTKYYDQTEDLYALKAIYDAMENSYSEKKYTYTENSEAYNLNKFDVHITYCKDVDNKCTPDSRGTKPLGLTEITDIGSFGAAGINGLKNLYVASYMANLSDSNYNFNKYLKRLRKSTNDPSAYRLIGIFKENNETRYASIKIDNPNPNRTSNLGEQHYEEIK